MAIRQLVWRVIAGIFFVNSCTACLLHQKLKALENTSGGRIGVFAIDTSNNTIIQYRANERFPFASTFKVIGVSAILKESMENPALLQQKISYQKKDLVFWSPITEKHLPSMTIAELCAATMITSDNTAINLLVKQLGGPKAVTRFAQAIGDPAFRLNGWEPSLNVAPGDARDTTTPKAMAISLQRLALGNVLASKQREQLQTWLKKNTTGNKRIRAGVPKNWVVGDKTGSGDYGTTNDIAILWPPKSSPIIVVIYFTQKQKNAPQNDALIAAVTRLLWENIGGLRTAS